ncbi:MAG: kynureninase [Acidobacteriota bacterium]
MPMAESMSRSRMEGEDRRDPLAEVRGRFVIPRGLRYFDGNSLGPLTHGARERLLRVVDVEWGQDLIAGWNDHSWIELPRRVGAKIARLVGAQDDEVVSCDSTSVNLYKLLAAAVDLRPGRRTVVCQADHFPTDIYLARGLVELLGEPHRLVLADPDDLDDAVDDDTAVVCLGHVDFRNGRLLDMGELTRRIQDRGALTLWDLSHSAGALDVRLGEHGVDMAVGCGYKFLNGGPGAPAFAYVRRDLQDRVRTPLPGWLGHRDPFAFDVEYVPADGVGRLVCGTPPILAMATLDAALDAFDGVDLGDLRRKSVALGDHFLSLVEARCGGLGLELACPRDGAERGSQVCLRHREGYGVMQALIHRRVVGDFRPPDVMRFGLCPLYTRFVDVWDAVESLRDILATGAWRDERFRRRGVVT